ncbi:MAG: hypothetical protein R6V57_08100 [Vicinamibacterales bacterium]
MDTDAYCREIEAHLCRRNAGHLVRIAGPAFELVRGWAQRGIPLKVAQQGIDRYVNRLNARGPRRRPARVEFCEADVLDAFDAWSRAVGIHRSDRDAGGAGPDGDADLDRQAEPRPRSRESLSTHLDRVIVRLTSLRTGEVPEAWDTVLDEFVRALDAMHPAARRARGGAREGLLADLEALDARLMERARTAAGADLLAEAAREAASELEPFATRLAPSAYAAARARCENRVLRERLRLPTLGLE